MQQLLDSDLEIVIDGGVIYLPLLLDPEIEEEAKQVLRSGKHASSHDIAESQTIISQDGKNFIKTLSIQSLIQNYKTLTPYSYDRLRQECLGKFRLADEVDDIFLDNTLKLILFQIMPHFIKSRRGLKRRKANQEEILDLIAEKIDIPEKYYKDALSFSDLKPLVKTHEEWVEDEIFNPPLTGLLPAGQLRDWLHQAMHVKILAEEKNRVEKAIQVRRQLSGTRSQHIAIFLYIADKHTVEIEGFGFTKMKSDGEYLIYKRTGEYILRDYYARRYLFPDCRVAVSTLYPPLRPFVVEKYKHPFLRGYQAGQEICITGIEAPTKFTAESAIQALEHGITALRYGYNPRRRNGYHSLDSILEHVVTTTFEDYLV